MSSEAPKPDPETVAARALRLWSELRIAAVLAAVLIVMNVLIEGTPFAEQLRKLAYEQAMNGISVSQHPNVVVIDISTPASESSSKSRLDLSYVAGKPTSRADLGTLLDAVVATGPAAVGIDIDFSPTADGYEDPNDPAFFRKVAAYPVPVRLGIDRSQTGPPEYVLGDPQFRALGASMLVRADTSKMYATVQFPEQTTPIPTLAAALADAYIAKRKTSVPSWLVPWALVDRYEVVDSDELTSEQFYLNYRAIDRIKDESFRATSTDTVRDEAERLAGKVVLLGDIENAEDRFTVPGSNVTEPGVLLHAAAIETLISGPLFVLTRPARILLDVALTTVVLGIVFGLRFYCNGRYAWNVVSFNVLVLASLIGVGFAWLFGVSLVRWTQFVWDDYLLVCVALVLHVVIDGFREHVWPVLKESVTPLGRAALFGRKPES
jgi:CHASE2 domain-containing sensor protein